MKPFLLGIVTALSLTATAAAQDANLAPPTLKSEAIPAVMEKAVDGFIRPGYHRFRDASAALETDLRALCAAPSGDALDVARGAFDDTVAAWSTIEIIRVGPVIEANRFERILFYPDRKSTGLKQVQAILAKPDESATSVETLKDKSVAMQGLGALEFVLFGTGSDGLVEEKDGFRCRYGAAIAGNLVRLGGELAEAWDKPDGIQAAWKHPGPENPEFRDGREAITALLGILVHGAEAIRDQRIETFYKGEENNTFPKQAIYWRSGNTFTAIRGNIEGLRSLMKESGMVDLLNDDSRSIVSSIDFVAKSLVRVADDINPDVEAAVSDPAERAKLDFLLLNSKDLILRLNNDYGGAIGLAAGFSFSDGD
ncbi:imelysin family protein [Ciceribacter selenitireducens]